MRRLLVPLVPAVIVLLTLSSCSHVAPRAPRGDDIVILLSIDGFRWDYLDRYEVPNLRQLAGTGLHARRLDPSFPSKTFPNHYTIATGLRPGNHGVVANWFWDPPTGEMFAMSKMATHWWDGGEPIWVTAENQGVRTGCFFWPGAEAVIRGRRPAMFKPFDKKLTNPERVDGLLAWFDLPAEQRPRFATLYFDNVDDAGHNFGPEAPETAAAVADADRALGRLLDGFRTRGLESRVTLIVVSDHGMSPTSTDRVIFFEDLMDVGSVQIEATGPHGGVRPKPGTVSPSELAKSIRAKAPPQLQVFLREEMPERFAYRANERIPPVLLLCDDTWSIERKSDWGAQRKVFKKGNHGWDPATPNMGGLFVAAGPTLPRDRLAAVDNVDVYNLLCALLQIRPAKNDGGTTLSRLVRAN